MSLEQAGVSKEVTEAAQAEAVHEADVQELHSLGYAQELSRRMSGFSNFAISFAIICILAGGLTSFATGLQRGRRRLDRHRLAARQPVRLHRGASDGPDCIGLPDCRRAVPLGLDPGRQGLGLGDRLV